MQILSFLERQKIERYLSLKMKKRPIARLLKREASVIRREINKNTKNGSRYSAIKAQARTERESHKTNKRKLETDQPRKLKRRSMTVQSPYQLNFGKVSPGTMARKEFVIPRSEKIMILKHISVIHTLHGRRVELRISTD